MSQPTSIRLVVGIASTGLVIASAGMGALFAFKLGSQQGIIFAALAVIMAVGLETVKPFAVSQALIAFAAWSIARGIGLALLALIAIAYSLTAEISLAAMSRTDLIATRKADSSKASSTGTQYANAVEELKSLKDVRTKQQLQAEIVKLNADNPRISCQPLGGPVSREICPKIAALEGEQSRADRRAALERIVDRYTQSSNGELQKIDDPGADAMKTYLASLGINADVHTITNYLTLVFVLALELGSALSVVLLNSMSAPANNAALHAAHQMPHTHHAVPQTIIEPELDSSRAQRLRKEASEKLMMHLMQHGEIHQTERGMQQLFGSDKSTIRRAVLELARLGVITHEPSKKGTRIRLAQRSSMRTN